MASLFIVVSFVLLALGLFVVGWYRAYKKSNRRSQGISWGIIICIISLFPLAFAFLGSMESEVTFAFWKLILLALCVFCLVVFSIFGGMTSQEMSKERIAENIVPAIFLNFLTVGSLVGIVVFLPW